LSLTKYYTDKMQDVLLVPSNQMLKCKVVPRL
jgi:hypothetical protein